MSVTARRELVFLLLQYLDDEEYKETVHKLERESGFFFNMKYFEECVTNGDWDEVESYLSGFSKFDENRHSMKIFFEIRKQRYLEALDRHDHAKAVEILQKHLKGFSRHNEGIFKELTMLLTLENFRENDQLSKQGDTNFARANMLAEVKQLIESNPVFCDKLQYPCFKKSRLRSLINQSLSWQHHLCQNPKQAPDVKTLFFDHSCGPPNVFDPSPVNKALMRLLPKAGVFPPIGSHGPFQPAAAQHTASLPRWMANPSSMPHQTVTAGPIGLTAPNNASSLRKRTPLINNPAMDFQTADAEHVFKRSRASGVSDEVNNIPVNVFPITFPGHSAHMLDSSKDLPKIVIANFSQGSAVKSMDFHPGQQSLLLVGTSIGDITVWEVGSKHRLLSRSFRIWDLAACSATLQESLVIAYTASVNRVIWSPDGSFMGVAYSKHIVHVYSYHGGDDLRNHLEIAAHVGNVTDLAFSHLNKQLCITSCGEDKSIKVWDAVTGKKLYTFEGHEAPVYSVYPHRKEQISFIFSTDVDGKIKAWLYDDMGPRVNFDAPGRSCMKMAYSTDGTRLFSCGTSKEGESYLVEWNDTEGEVKRVYNGLGNRTVGIVQFDTTKRFLVAGDDFRIKFWEMDNVDLLDFSDAGGGLPASPCVRFNKDGILLAVSTNENGIKVLANANGIRCLHSIENCANDASRIASGTLVKGLVVRTSGASSSSPGASSGIADRSEAMPMVVSLNGDCRSFAEGKLRVADQLEKFKFWKMGEVNEPSHLRSLRLPDSLLPSRDTGYLETPKPTLNLSNREWFKGITSKNISSLDAVGPVIVRLIYANSGGILALTHSGEHKLWKWQKNEQNVLGKATTIVPPEFWKPQSGISMTNDILETHHEDSVACFALSKNEAYLVSASGGEISLFNMITFKRMVSFKPSPPAATFLAFNPQDNNIIAMGMEDSTIQIYNVNTGEVKITIQGHCERVTGLAFSTILNVLVSSGADSQLMVWSLDGWKKQAGTFLKNPAGRVSKPLSQTRIKFQKDEIHLLVIHDTQLAIYEASKLKCLEQWVPRESGGVITDATYSCDCQSVFATFEDGSVSIITTPTFQHRCRIYPAAYLPCSPSTRVYPAAVAAHPSEPNQFAIGLSDGGVLVLEPPESEEQWGSMPPVDGGGPSTSPPGAGLV